MGLYKVEWILQELRNYQVWSDSWLGINKAPNRHHSILKSSSQKVNAEDISWGDPPSFLLFCLTQEQFCGSHGKVLLRSALRVLTDG